MYSIVTTVNKIVFITYLEVAKRVSLTIIQITTRKKKDI